MKEQELNKMKISEFISEIFQYKIPKEFWPTSLAPRATQK
jgi:hypothetical protein